MVAYSFKRQFVDRIRSGLGHYEHIDGMIPAPKRQTIRAIGKRRHARPGEMLQLYHGMRSRDCFKIGEAPCASVDDIRLFIHGEKVQIGDQTWRGAKMLDAFARDDGFDDWTEMRTFWLEEHDGKHLGPFHGRPIKWTQP